MKNEYTIWFRDPLLLFKHMLENPSFASFFDYAPQQRFANGIRRYENFMSGDWAWKQAVSRCLILNFYNRWNI
jgi:Plavaka transposase